MTTDDDDDDRVPVWRDPKPLFFVFGTIVLVMFLIAVWADDGRFAMTGLIAVIPTCVAAVGWASRDMY